MDYRTFEYSKDLGVRQERYIIGVIYGLNVYHNITEMVLGYIVWIANDIGISKTWND